jgi:hypothetical protein
MPRQLANLLRDTLAQELPNLSALSEIAASTQPSGPNSWSTKQELGHLIDSAANNHIRFVRAAIEPELTGPSYAQNAWVQTHAYHEKPWTTTLFFWHAYNTFLVELIAHIPPDKLTTPCTIGSSEPSSLRFLIEDYVLHLQHHLDHLLQRAAVTPYPAARTTAK